MAFRILSISIFLSLCLISCGGSGASTQKGFEDCAYGKPQALFAESMDLVTEHQFMINDQESNETAIFKNGTKLELQQSGCEKPKQTFQMTLVGDFTTQPDPFWVSMTADMFAYFATCDESLQPFVFWQTAVKRDAAAIRLGRVHVLEAGKSIKVDKIIGNQTAILVVDLIEG